MPREKASKKRPLTLRIWSRCEVKNISVTFWLRWLHCGPPLLLCLISLQIIQKSDHNADRLQFCTENPCDFPHTLASCAMTWWHQTQTPSPGGFNSKQMSGLRDFLLACVCVLEHIPPHLLHVSALLWLSLWPMSIQLLPRPASWLLEPPARACLVRFIGSSSSILTQDSWKLFPCHVVLNRPWWRQLMECLILLNSTLSSCCGYKSASWGWDTLSAAQEGPSFRFLDMWCCYIFFGSAPPSSWGAVVEYPDPRCNLIKAC